jgi:hypothetical protein
VIDSLAYLFRFTDQKESSSMRNNIMNILQSTLFKISKDFNIAVSLMLSSNNIFLRNYYLNLRLL